MAVLENSWISIHGRLSVCHLDRKKKSILHRTSSRNKLGVFYNTLSSDVEIDVAESWYVEQRGIALHREGYCHPSYITSH